MDVKTLRNDFPALSNLTYLDTAFVGLFPTFVRDGYLSFHEEWLTFTLGKSQTILGKWLDSAETTRNMIAKLIGSSSDEIAFTQSTSCGLNIVINSIPWNKGDNVVFPGWEHTPLVTSTILKNDVEPRAVKAVNGRVELSDLENAIDDRTKLVGVSQVSYLNGFRFELKKIADMAHEHGALVYVDSTQALGALKTDIKQTDIDYLSAGTYKFLIGPAGLGFFYTKAEHLAWMMPDRVGWKNPVSEPKTSELTNSARKFEYGTLNFAAIAAFQNSLAYQFDIGIMEIEKRILDLVSYLWLELDNLGLTLFTPEHTKSPIVSVLIKDAKQIGEKLMSGRIKITARNEQKGHLRVSPHFYNTKNDITHFITSLQEILERRNS